MPKHDFRKKVAGDLLPGKKTLEYFATNFIPPKQGRLGLRISPKGKRTWFFTYRLRGKATLQKYTLGLYPDMSYSKASKAACEILREIDEGKDPREEKRAWINAPTFNDLAKVYLQHHAVHKKDGGRADELKLNNERLDPIRSMKAQDIRRRHIIDVLDTIKETSPIAANRYKALLSKLFNVCIRRDLLPEDFVNPATNIDRPVVETARDRVLSDDEICRLWHSLEKTRGDLPIAMKILFLTGQRLTEILGLHWNEVDLAQEIMTLPGERTKNGLTHVVPMSKQVIELLAGRDQKDGFVFPARTKSGHVMFYSKDRAATRRASGIDDFTPHDLRRTMSTNMGKLGVTRFIIDRVTNHKDGTVGEVYDRYDYLEEKRIALEKWSRRVSQLLGTAEPKIIELRRQA